MIAIILWLRYLLVSLAILVTLFTVVPVVYKFWLPIVQKESKKDIARKLERFGFALHQLNLYYHP